MKRFMGLSLVCAVLLSSMSSIYALTPVARGNIMDVTKKIKNKQITGSDIVVAIQGLNVPAKEMTDFIVKELDKAAYASLKADGFNVSSMNVTQDIRNNSLPQISRQMVVVPSQQIVVTTPQQKNQVSTVIAEGLKIAANLKTDLKNKDINEIRTIIRKEYTQPNLQTIQVVMNDPERAKKDTPVFYRKWQRIQNLIAALEGTINNKNNNEPVILLLEDSPRTIDSGTPTVTDVTDVIDEENKKLNEKIAEIVATITPPATTTATTTSTPKWDDRPLGNTGEKSLQAMLQEYEAEKEKIAKMPEGDVKKEEVKRLTQKIQDAKASAQTVINITNEDLKYLSDLIDECNSNDKFFQAGTEKSKTQEPSRGKVIESNGIHAYYDQIQSSQAAYPKDQLVIVFTKYLNLNYKALDRTLKAIATNNTLDTTVFTKDIKTLGAGQEVFLNNKNKSLSVVLNQIKDIQETVKKLNPTFKLDTKLTESINKSLDIIVKQALKDKKFGEHAEGGKISEITTLLNKDGNSMANFLLLYSQLTGSSVNLLSDAVLQMVTFASYSYDRYLGKMYEKLQLAYEAKLSWAGWARTIQWSTGEDYRNQKDVTQKVTAFADAINKFFTSYNSYLSDSDNGVTLKSYNNSTYDIRIGLTFYTPPLTKEYYEKLYTKNYPINNSNYVVSPIHKKKYTELFEEAYKISAALKEPATLPKTGGVKVAPLMAPQVGGLTPPVTPASSINAELEELLKNLQILKTDATKENLTEDQKKALAVRLQTYENKKQSLNKKIVNEQYALSAAEVDFLKNISAHLLDTWTNELRKYFPN